MDSLRSILPKVLRKRGLEGPAMAGLVIFRAQEWIELAMPEHRGAITAKTLSHGTLEISCANSIVAQECRFLLPQLLDFLRRECPDTSIAEARITRGGK